MANQDIKEAKGLVAEIDSMLLDLAEIVEGDNLSKVLSIKELLDEIDNSLSLDEQVPDVRMVIENGNITVLQEDKCT